MTEKTETPAESTAVEQPRVKGKMVYLWKGKMFHMWGHVPDDWDGETPLHNYVDEPRHVFHCEGEISKGASPGQVYEFEFADAKKEQVYFRKGKVARYVGLADPATRTAARAMHDKFEAERAAEKAVKDDRTTEKFLEFLEPVRVAYWRLPAPARAQLLARIVNYVAGYKK